jgi:Crp-like helix-turn-helix domain
MADRPTALVVAWAWLLGERHRPPTRRNLGPRCAGPNCDDGARLLHFYARLRRRKLITGSTFSLPLTQVQIGDYLGLTVAHVNRVLRSLRDERIAHWRHCVTILNLDRLTSLAQNEEMGSWNTGVGDRRLAEAAD